MAFKLLVLVSILSFTILCESRVADSRNDALPERYRDLQDRRSQEFKNLERLDDYIHRRPQKNILDIVERQHGSQEFMKFRRNRNERRDENERHMRVLDSDEIWDSNPRFVKVVPVRHDSDLDVQENRRKSNRVQQRYHIRENDFARSDSDDVVNKIYKSTD